MPPIIRFRLHFCIPKGLKLPPFGNPWKGADPQDLPGWEVNGPPFSTSGPRVFRRRKRHAFDRNQRAPSPTCFFVTADGFEGTPLKQFPEAPPPATSRHPSMSHIRGTIRPPLVCGKLREEGPQRTRHHRGASPCPPEWASRRERHG